MKKFLHNTLYSDKILQMTADTMFLVDYEGVCLDIVIHANQRFFKERRNLLGENLLEILPEETSASLREEFEKVIKNKIVSTKNYKLPLAEGTYYFKCIMHPFEEGLVLCQYRDITNRTLIKIQLEKTNNKLQEVEKAAKIGQWKYDFKTQTFFYKGFTGAMSNNERYKPISLEKYLSIMHKDDRPGFVSWLNSIPRNTNAKTIEYSIQWKNKAVFLRLKVLSKELSADDEIVEGYSQNLTDIIKLDESLRNATKAINYASEDIFAMKLDGTLTFTNEQFRRHYLLTNDMDLSTIKVNDLPVDQNLKKQWMEMHSRFINVTDIVRYIEKKPFPHLKGILAFDFFSYIVRDSEGNDTIWTFGRDISEQIRHEEEVKEVNQIMDTVLKNLPIAISVKDTGNDLRYIYRNPVSFLKMKTTDVIGKTDFDVYPDDVALTFRNEDLAIMKDNEPIIYDKETTDGNGNNYIVHKLKILADNGDRPPLIISLETDITKMKELESELIKAKDKAENSDNLKSAFLANMSHEIRTPLNAIVGFSRVIADTQDAKERMEYYDIVESNNNRLLQLINEILDLSRIESGIMEFVEQPVSMNVMCLEVLDAHKFRCPENVQLILDDSDPNIWIYSDKNRLIQVFSNLIGNAFKFTREGSVRFGYKLKGDFVECYVKDTGVGFSKEKSDKVFERFAKLNTTAQGTGLGLSICRSIIEKLGGTICAKSDEGKGAEFIFTHPYVVPEEETESDNNTKGKETDQKISENKKVELSEKKDIIVLVAEDNDSNFKLLNVMIGKKFTLLRARDGIEAVTMFEEHKPNIILMDIKMPNMDGLDATRVIREVSPDIPIIALSAYVFDDDIKNALNCGYNGFIPKPVSLDLLSETLNKYL